MYILSTVELISFSTKMPFNNLNKYKVMRNWTSTLPANMQECFQCVRVASEHEDF